MSVHQVIFVVTGTPSITVVKETAAAGMEIQSKYIKGTENFAGNSELAAFNADLKLWTALSKPQIGVEVDDITVLREVEYLMTLESVPMNTLSDNSSVLVAGPFDSERMDYFSQYGTEV